MLKWYYTFTLTFIWLTSKLASSFAVEVAALITERRFQLLVLETLANFQFLIKGNLNTSRSHPPHFPANPLRTELAHTSGSGLSQLFLLDMSSSWDQLKNFESFIPVLTRNHWFSSGFIRTQLFSKKNYSVIILFLILLGSHTLQPADS